MRFDNLIGRGMSVVRFDGNDPSDAKVLVDKNNKDHQVDDIKRLIDAAKLPNAP